MPNLPYTIAKHAITVVVGNRPKVVSSTHMNFSRLGDELRRAVHDVDLIADLADISRFVARVTLGEVQIADGAVRWRGETVKNVVAERLLDLLKAGHDLTPLGNFLDRVMKNPLQTARDELFLWLESGSQPITPEGMVLAFKNVRHDYKDVYTGTIDNSIGQKPSMPREKVDPNRHATCSVGLHFCSFGYLGSYSSGNGGHTMIVLVDPADVIAIPSDYSNQKGRTWTYEVIGEVEQEKAGSFFTDAPVVEPYRNDESDPDVLVPEFDSKQEVVCVTNSDENDDWSDSLTVGEAYILINGTDSDGDVFLNDDTLTSGYFPARLFELKATPLVDVLPSNTVPGSDFCSKTVIADPVDDEDDDGEVPAQVDGKAALMFHHGKKSMMASEVLSLVKEHGQRGMSRLTGVPRTTIQEWMKAIAAQQA